MTVEVDDTVERYTISGVGPYAFSFRIFAETDIAVTACSTATPAVPTLLTYLTHYTVAGVNDADGGTVTLVSGVETTYAGYTLDIRSNTPNTQPTSIRDQGRFLPQIHEDAFDHREREIQDMRRILRSCFRYPDNVLNDGEIGPLSSWVSKYLAISSAGVLEPAVLSSTAVTPSIITALMATSTADQDVLLALLMNRSDTAPALTSLVRTAAEIAASVMPVNYAYVEGVINRYGHNTTPGTTDMTSAIQNALAVAHNGAGVVRALGETYLTGNIDWPGNNLSLIGTGSAYSYNTSAAPKTTFKAKAGTTIILDLVQTGAAEDRTGNHIVDIDFDGNSIALVGIDCAGTNIIERCRVRRCTEAGIRLENFVNSTRLINCGLNSNTGWGLHAQGVSATTFSVEGCIVSLNTLGGVNLETGVVVDFRNCVIESNTGPGLRIYRLTAHTNAMSHFTFDNCWFEDNASTAPLFTLVIDSQAVGDTSKDPEHIVFRKCRISSAISTRKYLNINAAKNVTFDSCKFNGSTQTDALTLASTANFVAFLECGTGLISGGLTATQLDNAIAQGTRCYASDRDVKRVVGAGAPAAAFTNSWVNEGGSYPDAKYWFDRNGDVHLEGTIQTGTITASAFTLPVGYRPPKAINFAVDSNFAYAACIVNAAGTVIPQVGSNALFSLNGICFKTG